VSYDRASHDRAPYDGAGREPTANDAAPAAPPLPFSERLRLETRASRDEAESAVYLRLLLSGALEPHEYATLMFQYHGVFVELRGRAVGV